MSLFITQCKKEASKLHTNQVEKFLDFWNRGFTLMEIIEKMGITKMQAIGLTQTLR